MSVAAAKFRHRVLVQKLTDGAQDQTTGEVSRVWVDVVTVWAAIEPLSVRDFIQGASVQSKVTAKIIVRDSVEFDGLQKDVRFIHARIARADVVYYAEGFLHDKDSGQEYITIPVSEGVRE